MNILNKLARTKITCSILACFFMFSAHATSITLPWSFTAGSPISASQMMGNFTTITSAISSTISSPWVMSSSNIYFTTGAVGIGSSVPARALDVSGSVAVNGSINVSGTSQIHFGGTPSITSLTGGPFIAYGAWDAAGTTHDITSAIVSAVGVSGNYSGMLFIYAKIPQTSGGGGVIQFAINQSNSWGLAGVQIGTTMNGGGLTTFSVSIVSYSNIVVTTTSGASVSWMFMGSV